MIIYRVKDFVDGGEPTEHSSIEDILAQIKNDMLSSANVRSAEFLRDLKRAPSFVDFKTIDAVDKSTGRTAPVNFDEILASLESGHAEIELLHRIQKRLSA